MQSPKDLLSVILKDIGLDLTLPNNDIEVNRIFLNRLNEYLYQSSGKYISDYHKYWETNFNHILNTTIDKEQAQKIAYKFDDIFKNAQNYPDVILSPPINREGLSHAEIANVRFFTTIQDFTINIYKKDRDPFKKYHENPEWYDAEKITGSNNIIFEFLSYLDATGSQGDKRIKWMRSAAQFLLDTCDGKAIKLYEICNYDVIKIRKLLADELEIGFSRKKADMFMRDMLEWKVWEPGKNIEQLNVASDSNTMKVALRSGLLKLSIPLLASYLDIYGIQYSHIDTMVQESWRTVWEMWSNIPDGMFPVTPASMDYLIYKSIGKKWCLKNKLKCNQCVLNDICPTDTRILKPPKAISIYGRTGWNSGITDSGGGGGISA